MKLKVLGSGQDAGVPHTGCYCEICNDARKNEQLMRLAPSVALINKDERYCYLIDASPDFKPQLDMLNHEIGDVRRGGKIPISGILLTHAHFGHCTGLLHLGQEALDEKDMPVFCTSQMSKFLTNNYPFSLLVKRKNIRIEELKPNEKFKLDSLELRAIPVPHRNEAADTVGYCIESNKKSIYLPDLDHWTDDVIDEIRNADVAILDGTFYSKEEIRRYMDVPHPPIKDTIELLGDVDTKVYFTHINHTNPVNRDGMERELIEKKGFRIAYDGLTLEI